MAGMGWELFLIDVLHEPSDDTTAASVVSLTMYSSKLAGCLAGALLVDRAGRRPLLCVCYLAVSLAELVLSLVLESHTSSDELPPHLSVGAGPHGAAAVPAFVGLARLGLQEFTRNNARLYMTVAAMYAAAEVCWSTLDTYVTESFPTSARAPAFAFSTFVGLLVSGVFIFFGPFVLSAFGAPVLLRMCACFPAVGGLLGGVMLLETTHKPLE